MLQPLRSASSPRRIACSRICERELEKALEPVLGTGGTFSHARRGSRAMLVVQLRQQVAGNRGPGSRRGGRLGWLPVAFWCARLVVLLHSAGRAVQPWRERRLAGQSGRALALLADLHRDHARLSRRRPLARLPPAQGSLRWIRRLCPPDVEDRGEAGAVGRDALIAAATLKTSALQR
jgi:hypothetical protein